MNKKGKFRIKDFKYRDILKKIPKSFYFPIVVIIIFITICLLEIQGTSIGTFNEAIDGNAGDNRIYGENNWIRSDEYLATTPILLSQVKSGNPQINENIGTGIKLGIQSNIPTGDFFSIFKPPDWAFLSGIKIEIAFSFYWWSKALFLILGTYLLLLELTKGDLVSSIAGSLIFFFTPFIQWWSNFEIIGYASIILFSLMRIILTRSLREVTIMTILFAFFSVSFGLILYPPYQIMIVWASIFLIVGFVLNNLSIIRKDKQIKYKILFIFSGLFCIALLVYTFTTVNKETINLITGTVYPGTRYYPGGGLTIQQVFNGFYNILLQASSNGVPLGQRNQSEASSFFLLYPAIITSYLFFIFFNYKKKVKIDYIIVGLCLYLLFTTALMFFEFPSLIVKYSLLSIVPPFRIIIGVGFASYLLSIYSLSRKNSWTTNIPLAIIISISVAIFTFYLGLTYYSGNQNFFFKPRTLSPELKIILVSSFAFLSTYLLLRKQRFLYLAAILGFSILSTYAVHPLYKGLGSIENTTFAKTINKYTSNPQNKWVVYGDHRYAQYILANGQSVLNGIHYYPLFPMWKIIDPEGSFTDIYNRYAHIHFSEPDGLTPLVSLIYADQINVSMDPCDERLKKLNVTYFLLQRKSDHSCLEYQETLQTFLNGNLYIYVRK